MKLVTVSGTQGSGKTTLIRELIYRLESMGRRFAVIVNEEGEAAYDRDFIDSHHVWVERLRGG